jgi:hypothetical protein
MRSGSESTLDTISPTSAASTKRERNRRKKENTKKRKAEEFKNKANEAKTLAGMGTMVLNERVLGGSGNGNSLLRLSFSSNGSSSSSLLTKSEATEQQTLNTLSQYIKYLFSSVAFHHQLLTLILLDNQPGRLW